MGFNSGFKGLMTNSVSYSEMQNVVAEILWVVLATYTNIAVNPLKRRVKSHLPFASIITRFNVYWSVHLKYIPIYIQKMQRYTVYLYKETALHVSGGTSTHLQELIQLYLQHLVFVTPLLLSAAIVEELEPV